MMFAKKLVLYCGLLDTQAQAIARHFAADNGPPLALESWLARDADQMVGAVVEEALAGRELKAAASQLDTTHPIVFFAVFPRSEIDRFIEAVQQVVPTRVVYASLTPTNMTWMVDTLVEHLLEEHEHFLSLEAHPAGEAESK